MKKSTLYILIILIFIFSCDSPSKKSMEVSGKIEGLRKGTLYLQKIRDSVLINIDSFIVKKKSSFILYDNIESPEVYYLYLDKKDGDTLNDRITFFGEKGKITIDSRLKTFESSAVVSGSKNQILWKEYQSMLQKFNDKNIEILKDYVGEKNLSLEEKEKKYTEAYNNLLKRRYLFALNYASVHADKEISAYIGLYEVNDANPKFLKELYSKMSDKVKNSTYGVAFRDLLALSEDKNAK